MVSQAELIFKGYNSFVPGLISICLERVWVPLNKIVYMKSYFLRIRGTMFKKGNAFYIIINKTKYNAKNDKEIFCYRIVFKKSAKKAKEQLMLH